MSLQTAGDTKEFEVPVFRLLKESCTSATFFKPWSVDQW